MKTNEIGREQISALADGELDEPCLDTVLAGLRRPEARQDWDLYHQIGDVLRSDDMDVPLSSGFSARFAERLDAEPTIIAPVMPTKSANVQHQDAIHSVRRWAVPSMVAAAAMATVAFIATPQLMVATQGGAAGGGAVATMPTSTEETTFAASPAAEGVVLRDSRIDDYLLAHQRFSPSVYSSAQYARSATFASDSNK